MSKVVTVTLCRKKYADITVTVPDGFDVRLLRRWEYEEAIRAACDELGPEFFEDYEEGAEVDNIKAHDDPADAARQLKEYGYVALDEIAPDLFGGGDTAAPA